jgi:hypothetical protein
MPQFLIFFLLQKHFLKQSRPPAPIRSSSLLLILERLYSWCARSAVFPFLMLAAYSEFGGALAGHPTFVCTCSLSKSLAATH